MNLQVMIANSLKSIYDFHDYEISKDKIIELTRLIIEIRPNITINEFENFIDGIKKGKFGILYKMPTSIMSMFQKFNNELNKPEFIMP